MLSEVLLLPGCWSQVHVFVLSKCDGLADDWSNLINMRSLHLDNIYPCPGGFQLHALADLGRLVSLQLGFEAPHALVGHWQRLELLELYQLIHLKVTWRWRSSCPTAKTAALEVILSNS